MTVIGGHTEVTHGLERPIIVGTALGTVDPKSYVTTSGAQIGDIVLLTKGIAIEGTSILARERGAEISSLSHSELEEATRLIFEPGISVVRDALTATKVGTVHAMHDPTEGGLASAIREMASASNVGVQIDLSRVPVLPTCRKLCEHFGIDPLGLLASGALLVAVPPQSVDTTVDILVKAGLPTNVIGKIVSPDAGCTACTKHSEPVFPLPAFDRDEITRVLCVNGSAE
jgi:hydrogenase maturation factor